MSKLAFRAQTVDIAYLPLRQDLFAKNVLMTAQRDLYRSKVFTQVYWSENVYTVTSIRSCPFSQGAIYKGQGMWSNMWSLDEPAKDSQGFRGVNPTYLTTARLGGIFFEIAPFKNSHDLL